LVALPLALAGCANCDNEIGLFNVTGGFESPLSIRVPSGTPASAIRVGVQIGGDRIVGSHPLNDGCETDNEPIIGTATIETPGLDPQQLFFDGEYYEGMVDYAEWYRLSLLEPDGEAHVIEVTAPRLFTMTLTPGPDLGLTIALSPPLSEGEVMSGVVLQLCRTNRSLLVTNQLMTTDGNTFTLPKQSLYPMEGSYRVLVTRSTKDKDLVIYADYAVTGGVACAP
jgi:hypothetical protein